MIQKILFGFVLTLYILSSIGQLAKPPVNDKYTPSPLSSEFYKVESSTEIETIYRQSEKMGEIFFHVLFIIGLIIWFNYIRKNKQHADIK